MDALKILWMVVCVLLFSCSLLSLMRAPTYSLWKLAVGVTEFPLLFTFFALAAFFTGFAFSFRHANPLNFIAMSGFILAMASVVFFLYPVLSSLYVSTALQEKGKGFPFRPAKMLRRTKKNGTLHTYTYKNADGKELKLDHYPSSSASPSPCIIVVHGGAWNSGDRTQLPELNYHLAGLGYHVAAINYRLAPGYCNPAPAEDVWDALSYLEKNAASLNIDAGNFVLLGRSAGGQIALLAGYVSLRTNIRGVISFYAPADMVWGWSIPGNPLVLDSRQVMREYIGGTCEAVPEKFHDSSPIEFVHKHVPPTLLIHGDNDCMVSPEHSLRLCKKLEAHEVDYMKVILPWATHGFDYNLHGPGGQVSTYVIERFLEKVCKQ